MTTVDFELEGVSDPRLAVHATSPLPAWLWSTDGSHVLWANPIGSLLFGAQRSSGLASRVFGPADMHRRQVAQLAPRLPANAVTQLQRLRGFGARPGTLVSCACTRLVFFDNTQAVLIAAIEGTTSNMTLLERLERLTAGITAPIALFSREGTLAAATEAARQQLSFSSLVEAGLDEARAAALHAGRAEVKTAIGPMVLQRIGTGRDIALAVILSPPAERGGAAEAGQTEPETARPRQPWVQPAEAPADFALFDAIAEEPVGPPRPPEPAEPARPAVSPHRGPATWQDATWDEPRQQPLRFVWAMDAELRFTILSEEFVALAGRPTADHLGGSWNEIAAAMGLDADGRVMTAVLARDTWSGITLDWPVEGGGSLAVELAGLPLYDGLQRFAGFRGFGVCRELEALAELAAFRRAQRGTPTGANASAETPPETDHVCAPVPPAALAVVVELRSESVRIEASPPTTLDQPLETPPPDLPENVVPFRTPGSEPKILGLTPVENSAFDELARQLTARLDRDSAGDPPSSDGSPAVSCDPGAAEPLTRSRGTESAASQQSAEWLALPQPPAERGTHDRILLDLLPTGVLIYRLDRLVYANPAFLQRTGYPSLHALEQAGGLDALYVEPGVSATSADSTSEAGTPVTIAASQPAGDHASPTPARLFTISWDDEPALALIFSPLPDLAAPAEPALAQQIAGQPDAEDLAAILDTMAEGILMLDMAGHIHACNSSAEALFGCGGDALAGRNLVELFAPESQSSVRDYLQSLQNTAAASLLDAGRDVLARVNQGGLIPLSMTMGRTRSDGPNIFAVFRDRLQRDQKPGESREIRQVTETSAIANAEIAKSEIAKSETAKADVAKADVVKANVAKAEMLARIGHELKAPVSAIIGLAEVMIGERLGPLANERYSEYLKDIRAAGERVTAIINDLTELTRIETGKLELAFTSQNLNELVESCVLLMQPQANRERIIIRTSLAQPLPRVLADARALRRITSSLIGKSIRLAGAGGQVIVSTAVSDDGDVILRVRDTGPLNDHDSAAAFERLRPSGSSEQAGEEAGLDVALTKALVEANRAQFLIKTSGRSGTLVEIIFARDAASLVS